MGSLAPIENRLNLICAKLSTVIKTNKVKQIRFSPFDSHTMTYLYSERDRRAVAEPRKKQLFMSLATVWKRAWQEVTITTLKHCIRYTEALQKLHIQRRKRSSSQLRVQEAKGRRLPDPSHCLLMRAGSEGKRNRRQRETSWQLQITALESPGWSLLSPACLQWK